MPFNLHLFMGTPFFSDVPFTSSPSVLDVSKVGIYENGSYYAPGSKYMKFLLSEDLASLRSEYYVLDRLIIDFLETSPNWCVYLIG